MRCLSKVVKSLRLGSGAGVGDTGSWAEAEDAGFGTGTEDTGSGAETEDTGSEVGGGGFKTGDEGLRLLDGLSTSGGVFRAVVVVIVHFLRGRLPIW